MLDALRLQQQGYPEGTVVVAGYQDAGKGRGTGRVWYSAPGQNLLFTLLIENVSMPLQRLPVLVGLGLAQTVERMFALSTKIKWPNDLLYGDRKLAGVLCEAPGGRSGRARFLVGVGLNCNQTEFPWDLAERATSLRMILGTKIDLWQLLEQVLLNLQAVLHAPGWKTELEQRLYRRGKPVALVQSPPGVAPGSEEILHGILHGLSDDGTLQLEQEGNIIEIVSGELRI